MITNIKAIREHDPKKITDEYISEQTTLTICTNHCWTTKQTFTQTENCRQNRGDKKSLLCLTQTAIC